MASVVTIGAGVAGLTTALVLAQKGYKITVVAQHLPGDLSIEYTSPWAASSACFNSEEEEEYDKISFPIFCDLATKHPESGVQKMGLLEYYDMSLEEAGLLRPGQSNVWFKDLVHDFRELPPEELPEGAKGGMSLTTVAINPEIYLHYLQSQLLVLGATFIRRHVSHVCEAFTLTSPPPSAVVNATGILASKLGGVEDKNVYPTRGQTILVRNECSKMYYRSGERLEEQAYIIPRPCGGGTILGGSRQHGRSSEVDANLAHRIATSCVALAPELTGGRGVEGLDVVRHNVGLRPSRHGGPRLELESLSDIGFVVHNYGASGAGYQSSWGMAIKATELLEQALATKSKT